MQGSDDPFRDFFNKMNADLAAWLTNEQQYRHLCNDYKNTLCFLQEHNSPKVMVEIGRDCLAKAKRTDQKIVLRCMNDLFVEFSREQAIPVVNSLISFQEEKVRVCEQQIAKIMASMRQVEQLIASYQQAL